ncbi:MAG: hypothetical protein ACOC2H_03990, partial [Spirochaetota bacterium]
MHCILLVPPLANVNCQVFEADVASRRLRGTLADLGSAGAPRFRVTDGSTDGGSNAVNLTVRGEYIVQQGKGADESDEKQLMVVLRMYDKDGKRHKSFQSSWFDESALPDELAMLSQRIITYSRVYYRKRIAAQDNRSSRQRPKSQLEREKLKSISLYVSGGYIQPFGDLADVAEYGLGAEIS